MNVDSSVLAYILGPAGGCGLILVLLLTRVLILRSEYDRVVKDNEKKQTVIDILTEANETLRDSNRSLSASGELVNEVVGTLMAIATGRPPPSKTPPPGV